MLTVSQLSATLGERRLLSDVSFSVNAGERLAIVGPNGAGKTTLLRIVAGDIAPENGDVHRDQRRTIGYLPQGFADRPDGSLADLLDPIVGGLAGAAVAFEHATVSLAESAASENTVDQYDDALAAFDQRGGFAELDTLQTMLARFGLDASMLQPLGLATPLSRLSGGQKTRAGLAAVLAARPDLLLLDEPTNHLDTEGLEWLERLVIDQPGAVLIVSHDRVFLDRVATRTLALDDLDSSWRVYPGGYSDYLAARSTEQATLLAAYNDQQLRIARMEHDVREVRGQALKTERETPNDYLRGRSKKVARKAVVRERKLERLRDSEDLIERPDRRWGVALNFGETHRGGQDVITVDNLSVQLDQRTIFHDVSFTVRHGERVALTGPNGSGKTTLLRTVIGELEPASGAVRLGAGVSIGRFAQEQETVDPNRTVVDQVRAVAPLSETDARNFLHRYLFAGDMPLRQARQLSYGERARLALALLDLKGANLLMLDEPLNHLDLPARERFETALAEYPGTIIAVLHDRRAIERIATRQLHLENGALEDLTWSPHPVLA